MDFPAVTVCNQNRVHCGRLKMFLAEKLAESHKLNFTEVYSLLENGNYSGVEADAIQIPQLLPEGISMHGVQTKNSPL